MKEEFQKMREVLLALFDFQQNLLNSQKLPEDYYRLWNPFEPMDSQNEIITLMKFEDGSLKSDFSNSNKFLYLPPLSDRKIVPIFSLHCDLGASPPKVSFYIVVFRYPDNGGPIPCYLGFRFEGSHATEGTGSRHDYCHVQIIKEFQGRHADKFPKYHYWLPESIPCIPIKAKCPVSLLISLLFSFYGNQIFKILDVSFDDEYKKPLEGILCIEKTKKRKWLKR